MFKGFGDADYLSGINDPDKMSPAERESEAAQTRTTLGAVGDVATKVIDPLVGLVRAGTTFAREAFPESETVRSFDEEAAGWQKHLQENLTPYQKAVDESRWLPGYGERRAMDRPFSKVLSDVAGLVAPVGAAAISGGLGAAPGVVGAAPGVVGGVMAGTFAFQGAGDALAKMRDFAMDTPLPELKKSPAFIKAWTDNGGDERAARDQFYNETKDVTAIVANGIANGLTFGAIGRLIPPAKAEAGNLVMRILSGRAGGRLIGGLQGGVEGTLMGATTGATGTYAEQSQRVRAGLQPNIDPHAMATGTERGAESFALPMAGLGMLHGRPPPAGPKPSEYGPEIPPGTPAQPGREMLDSDLHRVLAGQLAMDTGPPPGLQPTPEPERAPG
jgi:hypothetical protein